jgi:hypothetical protein
MPSDWQGELKIKAKTMYPLLAHSGENTMWCKFICIYLHSTVIQSQTCLSTNIYIFIFLM